MKQLTKVFQKWGICAKFEHWYYKLSSQTVSGSVNTIKQIKLKKKHEKTDSDTINKIDN